VDCPVGTDRATRDRIGTGGLISRKAEPTSFFEDYERADDANVARARGWAVLRAVGLIVIGQNGRRGLAGGKPTWEPAGYATLDRLLATI
jgi:hypothetical protein